MFPTQFHISIFYTDIVFKVSFLYHTTYPCLFSVARETLEGYQRAIMGTMSVEQVNIVSLFLYISL